MMYDYQSRLSPKDSRNENTVDRASLLDLRHQGTSSLAADRVYLPQKQLEQYQDQWELNFLNHLTRQICEGHYNSGSNIRQRYAEEDEFIRRKQAESRGKSRKKELSKYKAYAVKMKIPSYHQLNKPKPKEMRVGETLECKYRTQLRGLYGIHEPLTKMEEIFRANVRDIAIANIFEGSNGNIFKKRQPQKNIKNATIRKRSIKTTDKRREEDQQAKISLNKFLKTSTSPKISKKCMMSLDQSGMEPYQSNHTYSNKDTIDEVKKIEGSKNKGVGLTKTLMRSPQKQREKELRQGPSLKQGEQSTSKLLQKVDKAIHFKKKDTKEQSPSKTIINQKQQQSDKVEKTSAGQFMQASKAVIRTIYTSKDVIRNKSVLSKEVNLQQSRKQNSNQRVFIFNSEDNYIRRILTKAGWVYNHDHGSHFYHLKWVFKPDSIDYNLKPNQFVNHVKNSHELTSKHYLNKNLKSYLSCCTNLYSFYPHSYDFSKPSERQEFYSHFKKETMMILLQNVYEYFLYMRPFKVEDLTRFYSSLLQQDGSYCQFQKGESNLRKKSFRKIDMEDYRQYDNAFLVHMNLLIIALKYWRELRKNEHLEEDDQHHFLIFRQKEFEENFMYLEKYSKLPISYTSTLVRQNFQREYYATPSEVAIERVVKEYVYFQAQLGRQWRVLGRGNIWVVKPCSASRGNGIYLANDCSSILTDNRGIQSKIVQRYIQRPLIMRSQRIRGRKFDLRQWVLLRSVEPLEIYMFSHCYLRICSEEFDVTNINNLKAHLTNYSFNKRHFSQPGESVIDQDTFQAMLLEEKGINFIETIRPKIKEIVIRSIKSTQHLISDCGQACFSLLGYDILIDADCEPWLLQVNMSPACEERTDWLKSYLDVMGRDLLKIVMPGIYTSNVIAVDNRRSELPLPVKQQWESMGMRQDVRLKKIKTEISQINGECTQQKEIRNYVDTIFDLQVSKRHRQFHENGLCMERSSKQALQREKITSQMFVIDNQSDKEMSAGQDWEEINGEENCKQHVISARQYSASPINKQKFGNMEIYINQTEEAKQEQFANNNNSLDPNPKSPQVSPSKFRDNQSSIVHLSCLKWERICFEQYSAMRKDGDMHLEVTGAKISNNHIHEMDNTIDLLDQQKESIEKACISLQRKIRKYLNLKHEKLSRQMGLKINMSRLATHQFRESKSALCNREERSRCFDRINLREEIHSKVERPITSRGSNPSSAKNKGSDSFRQKIRSIAMQAASRQTCRDAVQVAQYKQVPIEQEICVSQDSLSAPQ